MHQFIINPEQEAKFKKWANNQPKQTSRASGEMGVSQFQFIFTQTNCGDCLVVRNTLNGEEIDLTDYESF